MTSTHKFPVSLTFHELSTIVKTLEEARSGKAYALNPSPYPARDDNDGFVKYDEDAEAFRVVSYRVVDAESAAKTRAELADLIGTLTGVTPEEDADAIARIRDARNRLNLQEAADKAAKDSATV